MKKYLAAFLAFVILAGVFAGCAGNDDVGGSISAPPSESTDPTPDVENSEKPEKTPVPVTEGDDKDLDLGSVSSDTAVYTNEFAGVTFALPEGWMFYSQDQLAEMMNLVGESFEGDKQALLEYAMESTVYDMVAYAPSGENIMVMFENISRYLGGLLLDADGYLDALESNFDLITTVNYETIGRSDLKLGGVDYRCLSVTDADTGINQDYVVRREGKYMICIAFTGINANPAATMGEYFT